MYHSVKDIENNISCAEFLGSAVQIQPRSAYCTHQIVCIETKNYFKSVIFVIIFFLCSQVVCLGALSCAMVAVGSCHGDLTESFLQIMMERDGTDLGKTHARYLALALALLYLGKQEAAELTIEALKVIREPLRSFATTLLDVCAYAGE